MVGKSVSGLRRWMVGVVVAIAVVLGAVVVPQPAQAAASVTIADAVARILSDTNALRAAGGLAPLTESTAMDTVAQNWSAAMYAAGSMTHNPNYSTQIPSGWTAAGENIAMGYSYTTVVEAWHQSAGHYANIMGSYNSIGIGYYESNGKTYFTQDFGKYATVPSPKSSAVASGAPAPVSPAMSFVLASYTDVLGRTPPTSDDGVQYWVTQISRGASRTAIAGSFNGSDEYRLLKIGQAYQDVLARTPDAGGQYYWLNAMRAGAVQPDDAHRTFLTVDEFYARQGGGTDAGYVSALYRDIIGRDPDAGGLAYWVGVLRSAGRANVVNGLWYATETFNVRVRQAFQDFLGRAPSAPETDGWAGIARSVGLTGMRTYLMSTDEYWNRAGTRFP